MDSGQQGQIPHTPQQYYFAAREHIRETMSPEALARFEAGGPPPALKADGYAGQLAYAEYRAQNDPIWVERLAQLKAQGPPQE